MVDESKLMSDDLDTLNAELKEFVDLLLTEDKITIAMLRLHLVTENLLERALIALLPGGCNLIDQSNLTYNHKLEIVHASQKIDSSLIGSLRQLNKVRNAASHVREASVGRAQIENIGRPLGKAYVKFRKSSAANLENFAIKVFALVFARLVIEVHKIEDSDK